MKWVLFFFLVTGLAYCLLMIVYNLASMFYLFRQLLFMSKAFNFQYKVLRPFLEKEMTDDQIYEMVKEKPDERDMIFVNQKLYILFQKNAGVSCPNTAVARDSLIKVGSLIKKIKDDFRNRNIVFSQGIFDENEEFFKELQAICKQKGEPFFYENVEVEEDDENSDSNNTTEES